MRTLWVSLIILAAAAPVEARAELVLSLQNGAPHLPSASLLEPEGARAPSARLLSALAIDRNLPLLAEGAEEGTLTSGLSRGERQALAFVLGIIPGFGLGHVIAGSNAWPVWLIIDLVLFVFVGFGFWFNPWWHGAEGFGVLIFLVERFFEGYFAYRAAGGRPIASLDAVPETSALASAAPAPVRMQGLALATF